jgi:hypothetical protein
MGIADRRKHRERMRELRNERRTDKFAIRQDAKTDRFEIRQEHKDNRAETRHQADWIWPLVVGGVAIAGLVMVL